jgi:hypothetical protein
VVQKGQEEYMQAAWEQVGDVIAANNKIRWAQVAKEVSLSWYTNHLLPLQTGKAYSITAPVQKRVIYQVLTVHKQFEESKIPTAVASGAFRSITRPHGRFMKKLNFTATATPFNLAERINRDEVIIVPPKTDPKGGINFNDIVEENQPENIPGIIKVSLQKSNSLIYLLLGLAILFFLLGLLFISTLILAILFFGLSALAFYFYRLLKKWKQDIKNAEALEPGNFTPAGVADMPASPDFSISYPDAPKPFTTVSGGTDSAEATRFKEALTDVFTLTEIRFDEPARKQINFSDIVTTLVASINPNITIPKRTLSGINIPIRIKNNFKEVFAPVMVYPEIDVPMYKPLADMSSELFLPNIKLIPENSITLLENNQKFIESYMVGINHEMSRELLWREYPTDQRGSYFRQFWDVKSFLPPQPVPADVKEQLRDIPKIHTWSRINTARSDPANPLSPLKNELGQHNQRALNGKTQLVLVIRGELLKKYPTAVVYANKADWGLNSSDTPDVQEERRLAELTPAEKLNPPTSKIKTPLFEAKVEPDVYFFGFDLDDEEARGTLNPTSTSDDPGWFFVIKERPGEPRFGFDIEKAKNENGVERRINWNNLSWPDIGTADGNCIELDRTITLQPYDATLDQENKANPDDVQAQWDPSTNSAELAYILYQVPVLVGVHASRMLPK